MELYFHDHSFVPLFIQVKILFATATESLTILTRKLFEDPTRQGSEPRMASKDLETTDQAASSISDADLVDAQIHG